LHSSYSTHQKAFNEELKVLEEKYAALNAPIFSQRSSIVSGAHEPSAEDLSADDASAFSPPSPSDPKGIPGFWLKVLQNSEVEELIHPQDMDALKYLIDIKADVRDMEFDLLFEFSDNPFFTNQILKKTYFHEEELDGTQNPLKAEGTTINWKPDKNLTVKTIQQKKKKKKGKAKIVKKVEPVPSFFTFFSPRSPDQLNEEDEDDSEAPIEDEFDLDFEMGHELKDRIIPNALLWYTGELIPPSSFAEGDEDDEEGDEDEDEEEEDDEDEDDEEERGARKFPGRRRQKQKSNPFAHAKHSQAPKSVEQPPECKQQ